MLRPRPFIHCFNVPYPETLGSSVYVVLFEALSTRSLNPFAGQRVEALEGEIHGVTLSTPGNRR